MIVPAYIDGSFIENSSGSKADMPDPNFFPSPRPKEGPQELMEEVNQSSVPSGGTIIVMSKQNKGEIKKITNNLFISNLNMSYKEKAQLLETFGASSVSFFGDSIKVYQINGQAVDHPSVGNKPEKSMNLSALNMMYNNHLRATKLIQNNNIGVIKIFNHLIYGYALNFQASYNASNDKIGSFSLSWLVIKHTQNLPGLFSEKDLEVITDDTTLANSPEGERALGYIKAFLNSVKENLIIEMSGEGSKREETSSGRRKEYRIDLLDFVSSAEVNSRISFKDNLTTFLNIPQNSDLLDDIKAKIKEGIESFIKSFEEDKKNNPLKSSNPEGIKNRLLDEDPKELLNAVGAMFDTSENFNRVRDLLKTAATVRSSLITRKMQITYGA